MSDDKYVLPQRIVWYGPADSMIELNQHGLFVQAKGLLEGVEVDQLMETISEAKRAQNIGAVRIPAREHPAPDLPSAG